MLNTEQEQYPFSQADRFDQLLANDAVDLDRQTQGPGQGDQMHKEMTP